MSFLPHLFKFKELINQAEVTRGISYGKHFKVVHPTRYSPAGLAFRDSADDMTRSVVAEAWLEAMG
jgi:hypothetical protein